MEKERADVGLDGRTCLARPNSNLSRAYGHGGKIHHGIPLFISCLFSLLTYTSIPAQFVQFTTKEKEKVKKHTRLTNNTAVQSIKITDKTEKSTCPILPVTITQYCVPENPKDSSYEYTIYSMFLVVLVSHLRPIGLSVLLAFM